MSDSVQSDLRGHEVPLYVLTYPPAGVRASIALHISALLILGLAVLVSPLVRSSQDHEFVYSLISVIVLGPLILLFLRGIVDLCLFQEIRLYQDRIVKVSKRFRDKEVRLSAASFLPRARGVTITDRDTRLFWAFHEGIFLDGTLADPTDLQKLFALLAALSGRKAYEFPFLAGEKLIKQGESSRVVTQDRLDAIDRDVLQQAISDKKYNRLAYAVLLVPVLFALMGCILLLYFGQFGAR